MTVDLAPPALSMTRHDLVAHARDDLTTALDLVVPFVLAHPSEAGVLVDLGAIASRSDPEWRAFRGALGVLFGHALASATNG